MNQNIILTIILIVTTVFISGFVRDFLRKIGESKQVNIKRTGYITLILNILIIITSVLLLTIIWSVNFSDMLGFASSIFAIIGVALFAQWSILSSITSSIIIFFSFPTRIGDKIKIIDGDNSITGTIIEVSLFQIHILDGDGNIVLYPNNLFIQKPIIKRVGEEKNTNYTI